MAPYELEPNERRVEIIKLLQGKEMRTSEIAEYFNVEERTIRMDLQALREGLDVFGVKIQIESKHYDGNPKQYYKSTVHPVMLALNSSELYALLKLLETAGEPYTDEVYKHIFRQVYSQITDYFEGLVADKLKNKYVKSEVKNKLEEDAYKESLDYKFMYWAKSGRFLEISYSDDYGQVITEEMQFVKIHDKEVVLRDRRQNEHSFYLNNIVIDWTKTDYK